jgi:four helix bundle suffix protein
VGARPSCFETIQSQTGALPWKKCASGLKKRKDSRHTDIHRHPQTHTGGQDKLNVSESPCQFVPTSAMIANAVLSLLNLCCYLLDRQLAAQAERFENEGGFTERLYRVRQNKRRNP